MSSTRLRAWKRRWLGLRHPAQNLVEFGIAVASVSVFGLAGLNLLGRAEEGYFIPLSQTLAPQAPRGTDDVMHPTNVTINCAPSTVIVGNSTTCAFTVRDIWTVKRTWPQGTVQLLVGTTNSGSCALVQDTSTGDPALSKCSLNWSPTTANVGSPILYAHYVPSDGAHAPPIADQQFVLTVQDPPTIAFTPTTGHTTGCWDANSVFASFPEQVEMGHPIVCHLSVTNSSGPVSTAIQVTESVSVPGGTPYFSCFTNNNRNLYSTQCNPAGSMFVGNSDATGQLTFVYRRYYATLTSNVTDTFTATATAYPGSTPTTHTVTIAPPNVGATQKAGHHTDMTVQCSTNVPTGAQTSWVAPSGLTLQTDTRLTGTVTNSSVTCTTIVVDTEPLSVYGASPTGNIDNEDAFAPGTGTVHWFDSINNPINDPTGRPATCQVSPGTGPRTYVPMQLNGLPDYASACSVPLKLSGHQTIFAQYDGEPGPPTSPHAHASVQSRQIDSDFP